MKEDDLHSYAVEVLKLFALPDTLWMHVPLGVKSASGAKAGAWAKKMGARPGTADFRMMYVKNGEVQAQI